MPRNNVNGGRKVTSTYESKGSYDNDKAQKWARSGGKHKATKAIVRATGADKKYDAKHNKPTGFDWKPSRVTITDTLPNNTEPQDPFWYAVDEQAIRDMASFPFSEVMGSKFEGDVAPVITVMRYKQCIGYNDKRTQAGYPTRSAQAYYNYVMQGFTTAVADLQAPDLMMIAIAEASLVSLLMEGKRAYECMGYYLQLNKGWSKAVVQALGWDYDDLLKNLANFRAEFNLRVEMFNKVVALPAGFKLNERWAFLARNIFTDTNSPEYSTAYAFVCGSYLRYDATSAKTGSCLVWSNPTKAGTYMTTGEYFTFVDQVLADIMNDDDVRSTNAAIRRVYGDNALIKVEGIKEDSTLSIQLHDVMNAQLHNMTWFDGANLIIGYLPSLVATGDIDKDNVAAYQENGSIISDICFSTKTSEANFYTGKVLIDMYDHMVTPGNVLDVTGLQFTLGEPETHAETADTPYWPIYARSEIVYNVTCYDGDGIGTSIKQSHTDSSTAVLPVIPMAKLFHLDSHPFVYAVPVGSASKDRVFLGEINKYTLIDGSALATLHDRTKYQLLMLPENNKSLTK